MFSSTFLFDKGVETETVFLVLVLRVVYGIYAVFSPFN